VKVLALETSGAAAGLAVAEDGEVTVHRTFAAPRGRGASLFTALAETRPAWLGLGLVAVGLGPGSYNGLRAACALAGSFRLALGLGVVGLPSPCLLDVEEDDYLAVGDARGGQIHAARVSRGVLQGEIRLVPREDLARLTAEEGVAVYRTGPLEGADNLPEAAPSAAVLARRAAQLEPLGPHAIVPIYLKPPHITPARGTAPRLASHG
jgi:tRNA threonylcarbamoyladenosine biosynthesis protein TsaB